MCWLLGGLALVIGLYFLGRGKDKEISARYRGKCTECAEWFPIGERVMWNTLTRRCRHVNCDAAAEAHKERSDARQGDRQSAAFAKLVDRIATARGRAGRRLLAEQAQRLGITPEQRLQLLLEISRAETDDTLEKVEVLKSEAVKRRRLEETLAMLKGDAVPDEMQAEQIALLEEALRTLDAEPEAKA